MNSWRKITGQNIELYSRLEENGSVVDPNPNPEWLENLIHYTALRSYLN